MSAHRQALRLRTYRDVKETLTRLTVPAFVFEVQTGRMIAFNTQFETLLGYTSAELLDLNVEAIQPVTYAAKCHEVREQTPPPGLLRWQYRRKDTTGLDVRVHYRDLEYVSDAGIAIKARLVVVEFWKAA